jgi:hypothetical protein
MDPLDGYLTVTCPTGGHGYQMLEAAPVAFCSVACAVRLAGRPHHPRANYRRPGLSSGPLV